MSNVSNAPTFVIRPDPYIGMRLYATGRWYTIQGQDGLRAAVDYPANYLLPGEPGCPPDPEKRDWKAGDKFHAVATIDGNGNPIRWARYHIDAELGSNSVYRIIRDYGDNTADNTEHYVTLRWISKYAIYIPDTNSYSNSYPAGCCRQCGTPLRDIALFSTTTTYCPKCEP